MYRTVGAAAGKQAMEEEAVKRIESQRARER